MRLAFAIILLAGAGAPGREVTITGGASEDLHNYEWTVTNHNDCPVTYVEFPHYHGDLVFPPEGWTDESTGLVGIKDTRKPGAGGGHKFAASASEARYSIAKGKSLTFALRIAPAGAFRGKRTVVVGFADGTRVEVDGVECPMPEPWLRRNFPMIGLGGSFALFLLIAHLTRKRKAEPEGDPSAPDIHVLRSPDDRID